MDSVSRGLPEHARKELQTAWSDGRLVLFLGAGVSQPYGLPSWSDLVVTMLVDENSKALGNVWESYRRPFSLWLAERYQLSPGMLARLSHLKFDNSPDGRSFQEYVRDTLYEPRKRPSERTLLTAIADLIERSEHSERRIPRVITLNFDDLLEQELRDRGISFVPVHGPEQGAGDDLPILHPHGYLPERGDVPTTPLVLGEDDYHRLSFGSPHWSQAEILTALRDDVVLFVGLSMSDPNLRRLLDAIHLEKARLPAHFAFRMRYGLSLPEQEEAAAVVTKRVLAQVRGDDPAVLKTKEQFAPAVWAMLRFLQDNEDVLFGKLGTQLIWYDRHDDLPDLIGEIGAPT